MIARGQAVREAERRFAAAGIESARLDAVLLVAHAAGLDADSIRTDPAKPLPPDAEGRLMTLLRKRAEERVPVSRLLGRREFRGLPFQLSPATLDPRPDSETLVEAVLRHTGDRTAPLSVFDLGVGTGCLLLSILSELPGATGSGSDIDPAAVETARANADTLGLSARVRLANGDGFAGFDGPFDWIVCNPPYIPTGEIDGLEPEVRVHDPRVALDGGPDGLDAFRRFAPAIAARLAAAGKTAVEFGAGQAAAVRGIFDVAGLDCLELASDLAGRPRVIVAQPRRNSVGTARTALLCR